VLGVEEILVLVFGLSGSRTDMGYQGYGKRGALKPQYVHYLGTLHSDGVLGGIVALH
jgi:hypothetical protein